MIDWIRAKQPDPFQRPRVDWLATWAQYAPFWAAAAVIICIACLVRAKIG